MGSLDRPGSPAGEAKGAYQNRLFNRTDAFRETYRERLLAVDKKQIQSVAERYLGAENRSQAVVTDLKNAQKLADAGFDWQKI